MHWDGSPRKQNSTHRHLDRGPHFRDKCWWSESVPMKERENSKLGWTGMDFFNKKDLVISFWTHDGTASKTFLCRSFYVELDQQHQNTNRNLRPRCESCYNFWVMILASRTVFLTNQFFVHFQQYQTSARRADSGQIIWQWRKLNQKIVSILNVNKIEAALTCRQELNLGSTS